VSLRVRSRDGVVHVTPESAGWTYVGFEVVHVDGTLERREETRETCVVVLAGTCDLFAGEVGGSGVGRESVFARPAVALYGPPRVAWTAEGRAELAVCTAPAKGRLPARLLDSPTRRTRGEGNEERAVANILMEDEPAESLLVTEVVTPRGHWSSYPPHKHDVDNPPNETQLDLLPPPAPCGRIRVPAGDTVLVPRGYHPVAADARHDLYYLNVMAGPVRRWCTTVDPRYR
jgi:5-deoxy-glucuronate isomerase